MASWEYGRADFARLRHSLTEEYWTWYGEDVEDAHADLLSIYASFPAVDDSFLPYQIVSMYEVLHAVRPEEPELRRRVVARLTKELCRSSSLVRDKFVLWGEYSDLASEVIQCIESSTLSTD
jgi:hypothetical protein